MVVLMPEKADPNASSSEKPLIKPSYRADIDGLRALAVLAVISFHAFPDWVSGGFIGVDVFFVISGFLITSLIQESLQQQSFSFRTFYASRIFGRRVEQLQAQEKVAAHDWHKTCGS